MWIIDIRHWLDETQTGPAVPQLKLKVKKITEIIAYATSVNAGFPADSHPKCWRRPKRKPCRGNFDNYLDPATGHIHCNSLVLFEAIKSWLLWPRGRAISTQIQLPSSAPLAASVVQGSLSSSSIGGE